MSELMGLPASLRDLAGDLLMLVGALFLLLASVGVLRMPDLFTRMQAATKASTLGIACVLLAVAIHFTSIGVTMRALAALAFFLLTAPVTAHLIGRASYFVGVPLWERTVADELRGRYNPFSHTCSGEAGEVERRETEVGG